MGFLCRGAEASSKEKKKKKGVGEMVKDLTYAVGGRHGKEDVVAAVVVDGRGEVKSPSPMFCP